MLNAQRRTSRISVPHFISVGLHRLYIDNSISLSPARTARVIDARKRVLVMEFIRGGRVDDLEYLAEHDIDRNKVSLELSRIFAQMVHIHGWFHAASLSSKMMLPTSLTLL